MILSQHKVWLNVFYSTTQSPCNLMTLPEHCVCVCGHLVCVIGGLAVMELMLSVCVVFPLL